MHFYARQPTPFRLPFYHSIHYRLHNMSLRSYSWTCWESNPGPVTVASAVSVPVETIQALPQYRLTWWHSNQRF